MHKRNETDQSDRNQLCATWWNLQTCAKIVTSSFQTAGRCAGPCRQKGPDLGEISGHGETFSIRRTTRSEDAASEEARASSWQLQAQALPPARRAKMLQACRPLRSSSRRIPRYGEHLWQEAQC